MTSNVRTIRLASLPTAAIKRQTHSGLNPPGQEQVFDLYSIRQHRENAHSEPIQWKTTHTYMHESDIAGNSSCSHQLKATKQGVGKCYDHFVTCKRE